jgi:hypothetical protein
VAAHDLTTREAVRDFLQKTDEETAQDEIIDALISAASAEIQRHTRIFKPHTSSGTEAKTFAWSMGTLDLSPYFARSVTALSIGGTAQDPGTWTLRPRTSHDGAYTHLKIPGSEVVHPLIRLADATYLDSLEQTVVVTGTWGYAEVPDDVEHWCKVTVNHWLKAEVTAFTRGFDAEAGRFTSPRALPDAAIDGLRPYARTGAELFRRRAFA